MKSQTSQDQSDAFAVDFIYGPRRRERFAYFVAAAGVLVLTLYLLWRARRSPVQTGDPLLIGHTVEVLQFDNGRGWGRVNGERWQLNSDRGLVCGAQARIVSVHGLTLTVEPLETSSPG